MYEGVGGYIIYEYVCVCVYVCMGVYRGMCMVCMSVCVCDWMLYVWMCVYRGLYVCVYVNECVYGPAFMHVCLCVCCFLTKSQLFNFTNEGSGARCWGESLLAQRSRKAPSWPSSSAGVPQGMFWLLPAQKASFKRNVPPPPCISPTILTPSRPLWYFINNPTVPFPRWASESKMGHQQLYWSHPRKFGQGSCSRRPAASALTTAASALTTAASALTTTVWPVNTGWASASFSTQRTQASLSWTKRPEWMTCCLPRETNHAGLCAHRIKNWRLKT